jgi:hypothetical protein
MTMFRIGYKIVDYYFGEIEEISDQEVQHSFLLGNISLFSSDVTIEMEWAWIPLLDFAYCFKEIATNIIATENAKQYFEFTENTEILEFSKEGEQLKISASFSPVVISTTVKDFEIATNEFHSSISKYVRRHIVSKGLPKILQKYLSVEV